MKLEISNSERRQILEMHLREKNARMITEQGDDKERQDIESMLEHECLKNTNSELYYFENGLDYGGQKYWWAIKQTSTNPLPAGGKPNVRYITRNGFVFTSDDDKTFKPVGVGSLRNCMSQKLKPVYDALRTYYTKNLDAKTMEDWATENVNVYENPNYKKIDFLGTPILYVDKSIPVQKSFNINSPEAKLLSRLRKQGAKLKHEIHSFEKKEMEGPYTIKTDEDGNFPNGLVYYLPAVGGARFREEDPTDVDNAYKPTDSTLGSTSYDYDSDATQSDPYVTKAMDRIKNLRYDKTLPEQEKQECAEVLRTFYDFYKNRREINTADDDFDYIKRQAQACVYEIKPSKFSSIFGARGGDVDRDTRNIIKKLTGEIPGIRRQDPYRLLPRRIN